LQPIDNQRFLKIIAINGRTHAYRRLRWLCGLGLAAVGVECIVRGIFYSLKPNPIASFLVTIQGVIG